ncbi:uncharacterized protein V1510DRAFT_361455, partial [Dipodascopsis tothii]|uniref:uncharacterized protein n=1 Tax=Dipodascopsis tothii TaxID=44089 RepID=UPI0034CF4428
MDGPSDSESEWETFDIGAGASDSAGPVEFTLGAEPVRKQPQSRAAAKAAALAAREERRRHLQVHLMHLVGLLYHGAMRNYWCNAPGLRQRLLRNLPDRIPGELRPDRTAPASVRSRKFLDGLRHSMEFWSDRFRVIYRGLQRPPAPPVDKHTEPTVRRADFEKALAQMQGSRDLGAQGYCALLRCLGVRARLVCSLQPVTLSTAAAARRPKPKARPEKADSDSEASPARAPVRIKQPKFNAPAFTYATTDYDAPAFEQSPYPVYWVEAWDAASMHWVAVDPVVLKTIEVPKSRSKFEPPASEAARNSLAYVIAYDEDGYAKDVTRRYARYYNAKTRKLRVTSQPVLAAWWDRLMAFYARAEPTDMDQLEDAALDRKQAAEELPDNVQDFRGHPMFVLERHLKYNEIVHPKVPCGTIAAGRTKNAGTEPIYRRKDVHTLRSSTQWYKVGRQLKIGQMPLKHKRGRAPDEPPVGLYAEYQTEQYMAPPVVDGKIPRNEFGNLDVFVPSMVPPGARHLRYKGIAAAAKAIGVDYVDAVVAFDFASRQATPRIDGIIVTEETADAVMAVYEVQLEEQRMKEDFKRQETALARWRRYLTALRIQERLEHNPALR